MPDPAALAEATRDPCAAMSAICLPAGPAAVPAARRKVRDALRSWQVSADARESAALITSELVTNAVQFGRPAGRDDPGHVSLAVWRLSRSVLIEVSDSSPDPPARREAGLSAERGRGLQIVAALCEQWGFRHPDGGGKVTWVLLPIAPHQPGQEPGAAAIAEETR